MNFKFHNIFNLEGMCFIFFEWHNPPIYNLYSRKRLKRNNSLSFFSFFFHWWNKRKGATLRTYVANICANVNPAKHKQQFDHIFAAIEQSKHKQIFLFLLDGTDICPNICSIKIMWNFNISSRFNMAQPNWMTFLKLVLKVVPDLRIIFKTTSLEL